MDDSDDDVLNSENETEMHISALHRYSHYLCVGTIGRNIMKVLSSKNMTIKMETIRVSFRNYEVWQNKFSITLRVLYQQIM